MPSPGTVKEVAEKVLPALAGPAAKAVSERMKKAATFQLHLIRSFKRDSLYIFHFRAANPDFTGVYVESVELGKIFLPEGDGPIELGLIGRDPSSSSMAPSKLRVEPFAPVFVKPEGDILFTVSLKLPEKASIPAIVVLRFGLSHLSGKEAGRVRDMEVECPTRQSDDDFEP